MHHGQNGGGRQKRKFSQKPKLNENRGKLEMFTEIGGIYKFCENRWKIYNMHH